MSETQTVSRPGIRCKSAAFSRAIFVALVFWLPQVHAAVTIPPRVRLDGVILESRDENQQGALDTLELFIGKETRIFLLDKIKIVGSVGRTRTTLQRIFPPLLRIEGREDVVARLKSPELARKPVTLEGFLYADTRNF